MTAQCLRCGRPTPDGFVCVAETDRAAAQLAEVEDLTPAARSVAYGETRRTGGGGSGKPGSRSPGNDDALDALDEIHNDLVGLIRMAEDDRGAETISAVLGDRLVPDPLIRACRTLLGQMAWARGVPQADEILSVIADSARRIRGIVDGPAPKRYLGPCGAELVSIAAYGPHPEQFVVCDGDVYAREGAERGRCRTCGAEVATDERRAWLDDEVRAHAFRAAHIADAYRINVKTIRSWADRGHLLAHGEDRDGRPLYNVGDVLDLAASDAARREGDRATRARRAAARAAESESAA